MRLMYKKGKQEALELPIRKKNIKLKRLRSSKHYQIEKNKKLEKQQSKFGVMEKLFLRYLDILYGIIIVYDGDKSVYTYRLRTDLDAGDLIVK